MTNRNRILSVTTLAALAAGFAFLTAWLMNSDTGSSVSPTNPLYVANSIDDAIFAAEVRITDAPPLASSRPQSLRYTKSTAARAKALLDPAGETHYIPEDDTAVWVFHASGQFVAVNRITENRTPYTSEWVVVPDGQKGGWTYLTNDEYDLGSLGKVSDVPGPLPTLESRYDLTPLATPMSSVQPTPAATASP